MCPTVHQITGYLITEDEEYTLKKLSHVLELLTSLLMRQDRGHPEIGVDRLGLQSLLSMMQHAIEPLLHATTHEEWRYVVSFEPPPLDLLCLAVEVAAGKADALTATGAVAALRASRGYTRVADTLKSVLQVKLP